MSPPALMTSNSFSSSASSDGAMTPGRAMSVGGGGGVDLIEVVARCWGVEDSKLRKDLDSLRRAGLDERVSLQRAIQERSLNN